MKTLVTAPVVLGTLMVLAGQPTGTVPSVQAERDLLVGVSGPSTAGASHAALDLDSHVGEAADLTPEELTAVVRQYCQVCHNEVMLTGNLSLQDFAVETVTEAAETGEKMIRKLRAGMMPPPGMPRPGPDTLLALVETLENQIDAEYSLAPNPEVWGEEGLEFTNTRQLRNNYCITPSRFISGRSLVPFLGSNASP